MALELLPKVSWLFLHFLSEYANAPPSLRHVSYLDFLPGLYRILPETIFTYKLNTTWWLLEIDSYYVRIANYQKSHQKGIFIRNDKVNHKPLRSSSSYPPSFSSENQASCRPNNVNLSLWRTFPWPFEQQPLPPAEKCANIIIIWIQMLIKILICIFLIFFIP